jgi:hypothetical protein
MSIYKKYKFTFIDEYVNPIFIMNFRREKAYIIYKEIEEILSQRRSIQCLIEYLDWTNIFEKYRHSDSVYDDDYFTIPYYKWFKKTHITIDRLLYLVSKCTKNSGDIIIRYSYYHNPKIIICGAP